MTIIEALHTDKALIGQLLVLAGIFELVSSEAAEICISEELRVSCPVDTIIAMNSADYGRMEVGKCIKKDSEFLGCTNNVLPILDRWCSGRQKCIIMVNNDDDLEAANENCLESLKKYLKIEYSCLEVENNCNSNEVNVLSDKSGHLSSSILDQRGCGSRKSPWIISASSGQTIQIYLIDFAASQQDNNLISCRSVYGFIVERSLGINYTICGGHTRERALYTSKTNSVEIDLVRKQKRNGAHFILRYTVTGCSEINRPTHGWYKREGNEAVIGCENDDKEWRLTCIGNKWVGDVGNCTESVTVTKEAAEGTQIFHISSTNSGAVVVLSVIAVVCGVVYINKYRMKQEMKRANLYKTYSTIGSNVQAYYRPVTVDQSDSNATCWDMSLVPPNQMTLLSDKCTCPTLQMRNQGDKTEGERSLERQSLYSSIRST